jgi:hypothetical protein
MRFKSDPGRVLTDSKTHRVIGVFDRNGIFETDDPYFVERLKLLFPAAGEKGEKNATADKGAAKKPAAQKKAVKA